MDKKSIPEVGLTFEIETNTERYSANLVTGDSLELKNKGEIYPFALLTYPKRGKIKIVFNPFKKVGETK